MTLFVSVARRRAALAALVLLGSFLGTGVTVITARPAAAATTSYTRLARGVSMWHDTFSVDGRTARATWLSVDLANRHVSMNATAAGNAINGTYQTLPAMARGGRALAGINADWFRLGAAWGSPRGGLVSNSVVYKSPRPGFDANFYLDRSGRAHIGQVAFNGEVTSGRARHHIYSINTVSDALHSAITYVTPALHRASLTGCTVVRGWWSPGKHVVTSVAQRVWTFAPLRARHWALIGCGAAGAWLAKNIRAHEALGITAALVGGTPRTLVSGGRVLLERGRPFNDVGGEVLRGRGGNPETFACVSQTGRWVSLGVVDGRSSLSAGVTYSQLTWYLQRSGCYSAIVFDGGGSTTLVARTATQRYATVRNRPSDAGGPRRLATGLFVYQA